MKEVDLGRFWYRDFARRDEKAAEIGEGRRGGGKNNVAEVARTSTASENDAPQNKKIASIKKSSSREKGL